METFSLSRADLLPLPLFCYLCVVLVECVSLLSSSSSVQSFYLMRVLPVL